MFIFSKFCLLATVDGLKAGSNRIFSAVHATAGIAYPLWEQHTALAGVRKRCSDHAAAGWPAADELLEHIGEPGVRIDAIELAGLCRAPNYAERLVFSPWIHCDLDVIRTANEERF
jgi:hypothetical protein